MFKQKTGEDEDDYEEEEESVRFAGRPAGDTARYDEEYYTNLIRETSRGEEKQGAAVQDLPTQKTKQRGEIKSNTQKNKRK